MYPMNLDGPGLLDPRQIHQFFLCGLVLVVGMPVPWPGTTEKQLQQLQEVAVYFRELCRKDSQREFAQFGVYFNDGEKVFSYLLSK